MNTGQGMEIARRIRIGLKLFARKLRPDLPALRNRLTQVDAQIQLVTIGALAGVLSGLLICLFRLCADGPLMLLLPRGDPDNFEELSRGLRFFVPAAGALLLGGLFATLSRSKRRVGIVHVLERLNFHQGYISLRSMLVQFGGGVICLLSGQSVGREGPAIHLGAAISSLMGQYLRLPHNSLRSLVGCGTAAAIAAAFQTPMAGVIFAMEVILMEYSVASFMPIMTAAVCAGVVSEIIYAGESVLMVPEIHMNSNLEFLYVALLGVVIGVASVLFNRLVKSCAQWTEVSVVVRFAMVGLVTGGVAWYLPEIMGGGYDSVNAAMLGSLSLGLLVAIAVAKLLVSAMAVGFGLPGGLIGPSLVIGAAIGGAMGNFAFWLTPDVYSNVGFYAMLGMGAMMSAVTLAPLAALVALLELTHNPAITLPGMLCIVIANLTASELGKEKSLFLTLLEIQGVTLRTNPVMQWLRRAAVGSVLSKERNTLRLSRLVTPDEAEKALALGRPWILIEDDQDIRSLMPAADLARSLAEYREHERQEREKVLAEAALKKADKDIDEAPLEAAETTASTEAFCLDLLKIRARRQEFATVNWRADLQFALDLMLEHNVTALAVVTTHVPGIQGVRGVITREDIEKFYGHPR